MGASLSGPFEAHVPGYLQWLAACSALTRCASAVVQTNKLQSALMKIGESINKGSADSSPSSGPDPSDSSPPWDEPKEEKK